MSVACFLFGLVLGVLLAWVWLRPKAQQAYERAKAEWEPERAVLNERLQNREQQYRELLMQDLPADDVHFVYLEVPRAVLERRAAQRSHSFMPASMLTSQLEALEAPQDALQVDAVDGDREKTVD